MTDTFFSELSDAEAYFQEDRSDDEFVERKRVFSALCSYVLSCKWQDTARTHEMIRNINLNSVDAAMRMDISPNTVRSARSAASNRLYSLFGKDVFRIIKSGNSADLNNLYDLVYILSCDYDSAELLIPADLIGWIMNYPRESVKRYSVEELSAELAFIGDYDVLKMKRRLCKLDVDKLHYILEVLRESVFNFDKTLTVNAERFELLQRIIHS